MPYKDEQFSLRSRIESDALGLTEAESRFFEVNNSVFWEGPVTAGNRCWREQVCSAGNALPFCCFLFFF